MHAINDIRLFATYKLMWCCELEFIKSIFTWNNRFVMNCSFLDMFG